MQHAARRDDLLDQLLPLDLHSAVQNRESPLQQAERALNRIPRRDDGTLVFVLGPRPIVGIWLLTPIEWSSDEYFIGIATVTNENIIPIRTALQIPEKCGPRKNGLVVRASRTTSRDVLKL